MCTDVDKNSEQKDHRAQYAVTDTFCFPARSRFLYATSGDMVLTVAFRLMHEDPAPAVPPRPR